MCEALSEASVRARPDNQTNMSYVGVQEESVQFYMWPTCVALLCLILFNNIQHIKLYSLLVLLWEVGRQIIVLGTQLEASLRGTPPPGIGNSQGNCAGRGLGSGRDVAAGPSRDGKAHEGSLGDLGVGSSDSEPDSHEAPPHGRSQWRHDEGLRTSENPQIKRKI